MRKIKNFIKKLSLTQQLLMIVVSIALFLIVFFFGFLTLSIDTFVNSQMYQLIHNAQDDVIENYLVGKTGTSLFGSTDSNIMHIIYLRDGIPLVSSDANIEELAPGIYTQIANVMDASEFVERYDELYGNTSLISIKNVNRDATIASIMPLTYQHEFKTTLLNSIVYMVILVTIIMFMLLLYWVGSIIHPLNQIRDYIMRIRRNQDSELRVDRGDEIGELASVLVEMNQELRRQEAFKEEMLQNISHDLKTPVATIKSYSEAIKDGIYPYETLEKSVDVIIEHANRLEKKVYNLLMLNRMDYITYQQIDVDATINFEEILNQVIVSTKQIRPEIDITFHVDSSYFIGQEEPWRVVVENLIDNALRHAQSKVTIELKDHYLSIYNDGKSIPEQKLSSLFKPYEMGEQGQFGLGLAIVYRVVTNYNYQIRAVNNDLGVTFIIDRKEK